MVDLIYFFLGAIATTLFVNIGEFIQFDRLLLI